MPAKRYTLYGVEGSYYAAKARSCLVSKHIPFDEEQCDRRAFAEIIVPRVGYPIVPVVITPRNETLQDTAVIADYLEAEHPSPALIPSTSRRRFATYLMEFYADEWLKVPALHYRWHYNYEFAHLMMGYNNDPSASDTEQRRVGAKIAERFKTWPVHLGVTEATRAAVEANFLECLELFNLHFKQNLFVLGDSLSLADCALMGPLYAHLYRDPYSGSIVRAQAPDVCRWIERMRAPERLSTAQHIDDEIPQTMLNILRHLSADFVPVLADAMPLVQKWLAENPALTIPRYAGEHGITIGRGKPYAGDGLRSVHPFEQWKLQRVIDAYASTVGKDKSAVTLFCDEIGASGLLQIEMPMRIERRDFRLVRAGS